MWKVNDEICFNHELNLAKVQFETGNYNNAKIHLQNAIGSLEELQRVKNEQSAYAEVKAILEEHKDDPVLMRALKEMALTHV